MREPVELEVVGRVAALEVLLEHVLQRLGTLDGLQRERRNQLQGHVDDDAEGAEPEGGGTEQLGVLGLADAEELTGCRHERERPDLRRDAAEAPAGAVRARRGGAGDGLPVDVAHVGQAEAVGRQQARELVQAGAGGEGHALALDVDVDDAAEVGEIELHSRGHGDAGEGVPGADGLQAHPRACRRLDRALHGAGRGRALDPSRTHRLGPSPVAPDGAGRTHRNAFPSPR